MRRDARGGVAGPDVTRAAACSGGTSTVGALTCVGGATAARASADKMHICLHIFPLQTRACGDIMKGQTRGDPRCLTSDAIRLKGSYYAAD